VAAVLLNSQAESVIRKLDMVGDIVLLEPPRADHVNDVNGFIALDRICT
jgi:hypothetical protein